MFSAFERLVAFRYLRARRQEGLVSVIAAFSLIGIFLGVATLIIVMSVMNGFREELLTRILGLNGHMTTYAYQGSFTDFDPLVDRIKAVDGIVTASPAVTGQVIAASKGNATFGQVRGVRDSYLEARPLLTGNIIAGELEEFTAGEGVLIGDRMARKLGVGVGDSITLLSPQGRSTLMGTVPRSRAYTVAATFDIGMFEYDATYIFMPLDLAQVYFRKPGAVTAIEMTVADPERIREVEADVRAVLGDLGWIVDWRRANAQFVNALQVERNVMFVILTLIVLVAAFNIIAGAHHGGEGQGPRHRDSADHGCHARADPAHLLHERGGDRGGGHGARRRRRHRLRRQHRQHPRLAGEPDRHGAVPGRNPLPIAAALAHRPDRGGNRGGHGDRAFVPGDDLPRLAGGSARSRGGAPL